MLTLENFPLYMERGMDVHPWSWIYFVTFVLITVFIVINVLIGIVLNSIEEARELERRKRIVSRARSQRARSRRPRSWNESQILRAALDELEQELALAGRSRS